MEIEAGELLIARLWKWDAAKLREVAERDRDTALAEGEVDPDLSISVFGLPVEPGMSDEVAMRILCQKIEPHANARWVAFTTERRLREQGFKIRLSEPPPSHYDVILGTDLDEADVEGLAKLFCEQQRRRFPTCSL